MTRETGTAMRRLRRIAADFGQLSRQLSPLLSLAALLAASVASAQALPSNPAQASAQPAPANAGPIAIVPLAGKNGAQTPTVTGALEVTADKAIIAASGAVTSGDATTEVTLPNRGVLRVCARTTVKLAVDSSVPANETPGLLMALDRGAMEADLATGPNADIVLTPDFRIMIAGPGTANLKVRLGRGGDTCVDNAGVAQLGGDGSSSLGRNSGPSAPYVVVTGLFDNGVYRVQPGQRVLFEHGSLNEVVDNEKEPCGCPAPEKGSNAFPLAESEGLAPLAKPAPAPEGQNRAASQAIAPLVYNSAEHAPQPAPVTQPAPTASTAGAAANPAAKPHAAKKKLGFFRHVGRFFKRLFGAE